MIAPSKSTLNSARLRDTSRTLGICVDLRNSGVTISVDDSNQCGAQIDFEIAARLGRQFPFRIYRNRLLSRVPFPYRQSKNDGKNDGYVSIDLSQNLLGGIALPKAK
jgi:hypothetical protein